VVERAFRPSRDGDDHSERRLRVISTRVDGERCTAFVEVSEDYDDIYLRLHALRFNGQWSLVEIEDLETGLPYMRTALRYRNSEGRSDSDPAYSPVERALGVRFTDSDKALATIDKAIESSPSDPTLL
jgi:hypothetical protein